MKPTYDSEANAYYLYFTDAESPAVAETERVTDGVLLGYNEQGHIIGVDVLNATRCLHLSTLKAAEQLADSIA